MDRLQEFVSFLNFEVANSDGKTTGPQDERKSEPLLGVMSEPLQKLNSVRMMKLAYVRQLEVDAMRLGGGLLEGERGKAQSEADAINGIFWHIVKLELGVWDVGLGLRTNHEIVKHESKGILPRSISDLLDELGK